MFNGVSPLDDGLEIRAGTVYFNKPQFGGVNYHAVIVVAGGPVTVGDGGGGANADRLILIGTVTDQIGGVQPGHRRRFRPVHDGGCGDPRIAARHLTLQRLDGVAACMNTGAIRSRWRAMSRRQRRRHDSTTPAATLAGNLNMNGATRIFTVNDTFALNAAEDLVISAVLSNGSLTKAGYGTTALTGANTYAGATNVNAATLDFNAGFTNGMNVLVGGTLIARGSGHVGTTATADVTVNAGGAPDAGQHAAGTANRIDNAPT